MAKKNPTASEQIAKQILANYDLKTAQDVQDVLKQIFGPLFESMLKGEMENHLGYAEHERTGTSNENARNGNTPKTSKTSKTTRGEVPIKVPRDRQGTFSSATRCATSHARAGVPSRNS